MDDLTEKLDELERLYQAMTPGPWEAYATKYILQATGDRSVFTAEAETKSNADGIVAIVNAFPALLAAARERETIMDECRLRGIELEAARNAGPPGLWTCPKCGFVCHMSVLSAFDGSVGPNTKEPEPCPNDGEQMRRVTWREQAKDMLKCATEQMEHAVQAETERDTLRQQVATLTAAIRCTKHLAVPVQNRNEHTGGECGGCIAERVSALEEALREAEWNCAPGSGFCPLCHEPEDPMTYGNGKKVPGGHTRDCKLRALLTPKGETTP